MEDWKIGRLEDWRNKDLINYPDLQFIND